MDKERLERFNKALERFALGLSDEFVTSDGTTYRRLHNDDGDELERRSADGDWVIVPFSSAQVDMLLATARAENAETLDEVWRKATGWAPSDSPHPPKRQRRAPRLN